MCCVCITHGIVGSTMAHCHNAIFCTQAALMKETLCALCFRKRTINRVIEYEDRESPDLSILTFLSLHFSLTLWMLRV